MYLFKHTNMTAQQVKWSIADLWTQGKEDEALQMFKDYWFFFHTVGQDQKNIKRSVKKIVQEVLG